MKFQRSRRGGFNVWDLIARIDAKLKSAMDKKTADTKLSVHVRCSPTELRLAFSSKFHERKSVTQTVSKSVHEHLANLLAVLLHDEERARDGNPSTPVAFNLDIHPVEPIEKVLTTLETPRIADAKTDVSSIPGPAHLWMLAARYMFSHGNANRVQFARPDEFTVLKLPETKVNDITKFRSTQFALMRKIFIPVTIRFKPNMPQHHFLIVKPEMCNTFLQELYTHENTPAGPVALMGFARMHMRILNVRRNQILRFIRTRLTAQLQRSVYRIASATLIQKSISLANDKATVADIAMQQIVESKASYKRWASVSVRKFNNFSVLNIDLVNLNRHSLANHWGFIAPLEGGTDNSEGSERHILVATETDSGLCAARWVNSKTSREEVLPAMRSIFVELAILHGCVYGRDIKTIQSDEGSEFADIVRELTKIKYTRSKESKNVQVETVNKLLCLHMFRKFVLTDTGRSNVELHEQHCNMVLQNAVDAINNTNRAGLGVMIDSTKTRNKSMDAKVPDSNRRQRHLRLLKKLNSGHANKTELVSGVQGSVDLSLSPRALYLHHINAKALVESVLHPELRSYDESLLQMVRMSRPVRARVSMEQSSDARLLLLNDAMQHPRVHSRLERVMKKANLRDSMNHREKFLKKVGKMNNQKRGALERHRKATAFDRRISTEASENLIARMLKHSLWDKMQRHVVRWGYTKESRQQMHLPVFSLVRVLVDDTKASGSIMENRKAAPTTPIVEEDLDCLKEERKGAGRGRINARGGRRGRGRQQQQQNKQMEGVYAESHWSLREKNSDVLETDTRKGAVNNILTHNRKRFYKGYRAHWSYDVYVVLCVLPTLQSHTNTSKEDASKIVRLRCRYMVCPLWVLGRRSKTFRDAVRRNPTRLDLVMRDLRRNAKRFLTEEGNWADAIGVAKDLWTRNLSQYYLMQNTEKTREVDAKTDRQKYKSPYPWKIRPELQRINWNTNQASLMYPFLMLSNNETTRRMHMCAPIYVHPWQYEESSLTQDKAKDLTCPRVWRRTLLPVYGIRQRNWDDPIRSSSIINVNDKSYRDAAKLTSEPLISVGVVSATPLDRKDNQTVRYNSERMTKTDVQTGLCRLCEKKNGTFSSIRTSMSEMKNLDIDLSPVTRRVKAQSYVMCMLFVFAVRCGYDLKSARNECKHTNAFKPENLTATEKLMYDTIFLKTVPKLDRLVFKTSAEAYNALNEQIEKLTKKMFGSTKNKSRFVRLWMRWCMRSMLLFMETPTGTQPYLDAMLKVKDTVDNKFSREIFDTLPSKDAYYITSQDTSDEKDARAKQVLYRLFTRMNEIGKNFPSR